MGRRGRVENVRTMDAPTVDMLWPAHPSDDWYPCHARHTVRILVFAPLDDRPWRVTIWGADDYGLETWMTEEEKDAFLRDLPNTLTKSWLSKRRIDHA